MWKDVKKKKKNTQKICEIQTFGWNIFVTFYKNEFIDWLIEAGRGKNKRGKEGWEK